MKNACTKLSFLAAVIFLLLIDLTSVILADEAYDLLRKQMLEEQIVSRGVRDRKVLDAMLKVERHQFVPLKLRHLAYIDSPLPIGEGQTISQPYIVALMTELLQLQGDEKVLEIGTGSGYQAAILAELAKAVYTIEIIEKLTNQAKKKLEGLGYKNIEVKCGDGFLGWQEHAPFDAIIVTCAPSSLPQKLLEQLIPGGRMVVPVGDQYQQLQLVIKDKNGNIKVKNIIPVRFVPMIKGQ